MRRTLVATAAALALGLFAAACGKSASTDTGTGTAVATTRAAAPPPPPRRDAAGCLVVRAPAPRGPGTERRPTLRLSAAKRYVVTIRTNCGTIGIVLDVKRAPRTASSFASLVSRGFYDGLTFHRVLADFVIQGGDPLGNGQGGPGYGIVEKPPANLRYTRGVVAMAKAGVDPPGASGSQFFIVTAEDAGLPPDYALVGKVASGSQTINRIIAEPVQGPNGTPQNPIVIERATISPRP